MKKILWVNSLNFFKEDLILSTFKNKIFNLTICENGIYLNCHIDKIEVSLASVFKFLNLYNESINTIVYVKSKNNKTHNKGYFANFRTNYFQETKNHPKEKEEIDIKHIPELYNSELKIFLNSKDDNISILASENNVGYASLIFNNLEFVERKQILKNIFTLSKN